MSGSSSASAASASPDLPVQPCIIVKSCVTVLHHHKNPPDPEVIVRQLILFHRRGKRPSRNSVNDENGEGLMNVAGGNANNHGPSGRSEQNIIINENNRPQQPQYQQQHYHTSSTATTTTNTTSVVSVETTFGPSSSGTSKLLAAVEDNDSINEHSFELHHHHPTQHLHVQSMKPPDVTTIASGNGSGSRMFTQNRSISHHNHGGNNNNSNNPHNYDDSDNNNMIKKYTNNNNGNNNVPGLILGNNINNKVPGLILGKNVNNNRTATINHHHNNPNQSSLSSPIITTNGSGGRRDRGDRDNRTNDGVITVTSGNGHQLMNGQNFPPTTPTTISSISSPSASSSSSTVNKMTKTTAEPHQLLQSPTSLSNNNKNSRHSPLKLNNGVANNSDGNNRILNGLRRSPTTTTTPNNNNNGRTTTTNAAAAAAGKIYSSTFAPSGGADEGLVLIRIRPDAQGRFGFNVKGGCDQNYPIIVSRVAPGSPADQCYPRLNEGDQVLCINQRDVADLTHDQVVRFIRSAREPPAEELLLTVRPNVYMGEDIEEPDFQYVPESSSRCSVNVPRSDLLTQSILLLRDSLSSGAAISQFEQLHRKTPGMSMDICKLPENLSKNRYRDILPYDSTRVIIRESPSGNYINSNFMEVPASGIVNRYIAGQGPLPHTTADFWAVVWEQLSTTVVMLTATVERGRVKCHQYWPRLYESQDLGQLHVTCLREKESPSTATREFSIIHKETKEERLVVQMQYQAWPDHGVPENHNEFVDFVQEVRSQRVGCMEPIIVHCSAGIGRTGVLILMETAMCLIEANEPVYPLDIVRTMRDQRPMLIQTSSQYKFVCDAIVKAYKDGFVKPLPEYS